ncbi:hypothetical protein SAMN04487895_101513 [Paenibacillus sophorae]|uniref:Acb2/Tad1 hairpin domain-containing protein n=1 Tax=Paenibacillus sophorae TaxID=1333845 RepID=A0A1H8GHL6_9BACL|nr:hypothetical protein SAMN04487895_101513 [Paenibacillus sophorae]
MIKCIDYKTFESIGETDFVPDYGGFEILHNDYTYSLVYTVDNIAFFEKKKFNIAIENNFSYHPPKVGQSEKYQQIREKAKEFAYLIDELAPSSREKSLAMTNLEQSVFWANAAIARNE